MTPPRKTQFQNGQSCNPHGRPKGSRSRWSSSYAETILKAGDRVITVTENGRPVSMTLHEATLRAEQSAALKGSPMAQHHLIDTYLKADAERRHEIADECGRWEEIRNELIRLRAEVEKVGRPPSIPFPHPDDIVIRTAVFGLLGCSLSAFDVRYGAEVDGFGQNDQTSVADDALPRLEGGGCCDPPREDLWFVAQRQRDPDAHLRGAERCAAKRSVVRLLDPLRVEHGPRRKKVCAVVGPPRNRT